MKCIFCELLKGNIKYYGNLKEYTYWKAIISREQHTIGTIIIMLKRHVVRFSEINKEELLEFNSIQKELEYGLDTLFKPDLYNYLQCGNSMEHLHIHLIPRYTEKREYINKTFEDSKYGDSVKETIVIENIEIIESLKKDILKIIQK